MPAPTVSHSSDAFMEAIKASLDIRLFGYSDTFYGMDDDASSTEVAKIMSPENIVSVASGFCIDLKKASELKIGDKCFDIHGKEHTITRSEHSRGSLLKLSEHLPRSEVIQNTFVGFEADVLLNFVVKTSLENDPHLKDGAVVHSVFVPCSKMFRVDDGELIRFLESHSSDLETCETHCQSAFHPQKLHVPQEVLDQYPDLLQELPPAQFFVKGGYLYNLLEDIPELMPYLGLQRGSFVKPIERDESNLTEFLAGWLGLYFGSGKLESTGIKTTEPGDLLAYCSGLLHKLNEFIAENNRDMSTYRLLAGSRIVFPKLKLSLTTVFKNFTQTDAGIALGCPDEINGELVFENRTLDDAMLSNKFDTTPVKNLDGRTLKPTYILAFSNDGNGVNTDQNYVESFLYHLGILSTRAHGIPCELFRMSRPATLDFIAQLISASGTKIAHGDYVSYLFQMKLTDELIVHGIRLLLELCNYDKWLTDVKEIQTRNGISKIVRFTFSGDRELNGMIAVKNKRAQPGQKLVAPTTLLPIKSVAISRAEHDLIKVVTGLDSIRLFEGTCI
ncbi:hypothetical protein Cantr_08552 [Candida viswanathii]|uniref:Uncharacterized protein n=1 Tax=Candida viswanathii TaxID=5486 RepID=A0A367Y5Y1_9ASCO|nr:hypothetical protein Cantr_08552 [Candida viswanathii]